MSEMASFLDSVIGEKSGGGGTPYYAAISDSFVFSDGAAQRSGLTVRLASTLAFSDRIYRMGNRGSSAPSKGSPLGAAGGTRGSSAAPKVQ